MTVSETHRTVETHSTVEAFLSEHRELLRQIVEMRALWFEVDQIGEGPRFADMSHTVRSLRTTLAEHFQNEECDGYLSSALQIAPRFTEKADELQGQHSKFLEMLDEFASRLDDCGFECWDDVGKQVESFVSDLQQHETEENRIMQSAFNDDVGSGD